MYKVNIEISEMNANLLILLLMNLPFYSFKNLLYKKSWRRCHTQRILLNLITLMTELKVWWNSVDIRFFFNGSVQKKKSNRKVWTKPGQCRRMWDSGNEKCHVKKTVVSETCLTSFSQPFFRRTPCGPQIFLFGPAASTTEDRRSCSSRPPPTPSSQRPSFSSEA